MYGRELTKEMLLNYGVTNVTEDGKVFKGEREVKQSLNNNGYYVVNLFKDKEIYTVGVHRIVKCWFDEFIPSGYVVDHMDNNKRNNNYDNLQLLTPSENIQKTRPTKDFMRKCDLDKPRMFYQLELNKLEKLYSFAKEIKDKKKIKTYRNRLGVVKSYLRYYDANK